jgi:N-methylhydantoinase A
MDALESGCEQLGTTVEDVLVQTDSVRYATTLGTNALITRAGPAVGLITTAGFGSTVPLSRGRGYGDGLELSRQADLPRARRPEPLVPMTRITTVRERVDHKGEVVAALDEDGLRMAVRSLVDQGAEAIVVSFVNSVVNPEHELRAQEVILEEYPTHNLGAIPVVLSHQITGRRGEYVRTMSAILDAYLHDEMYHGLTSLQIGLRNRGYDRPMLVIHNTGGTAQLNSTHALQTIHSGPVAGASASELLTDQYGLGRAVATDMGGTSFDIAIVVGGGIKLYDFNPVIDRWLVTVPMLHLVTLGAGGGSIARYERLHKTLEVGPTSAGSDPGPACYDRGGTDATVTDADLVLGYLNTDSYAGGALPLIRRRAEQVIGDLADDLGVSLIEAALMIRRRTDTNMANGISTELGVRGYDASKFTILAYGGNGPLHCVGIANLLGVDRVFVPPLSSVFSALGVSAMQQLHIHEHSVAINLYDSVSNTMLRDYDELNGLISQLEKRGYDDLARQGVSSDLIRHRLECDMRYGNQLVETSVVGENLRFTSVSDVIALIDRFNKDYGNRFGEGSEAPEAGIRITTLRVASCVEPEVLVHPKLSEQFFPAPAELIRRNCWFQGEKEAVETAVYSLSALQPGAVVSGPAIVEADTTTYLVEPHWELTILSSDGAASFHRSSRQS